MQLRDVIVKAWGELQKPDELKEATFDQFFDLRFFALPHKFLDAPGFDAGVQKLRRRSAPFFYCIGLDRIGIGID